MAVVPRLLVPIARAVARTVAGEGVRQVSERFGEDIEDVLRDVLDGDPEDASTEEVRAALEQASLPEQRLRQLEEVIMVDFNTFISVGLDQCAPSGEGSGPERNRVFSELVQLWNAEKEQIAEMSVAELRQQLNCP